MATMTRAQQREANAKQRQLRKYRERLQQEQRRAPRYLQALEQALVDLGLPDTLVAEIEWRLQAQVNLLGKIFGMMFPTMFGCRTVYELTQVRVWDKNFPSRILGALPQQKWIRQLQRRG
jgi:uncharacterized paraquat-inducible protein A